MLSSYQMWSGVFAAGCMLFVVSIVLRRGRASTLFTVLGWLGVLLMILAIVLRLHPQS